MVKVRSGTSSYRKYGKQRFRYSSEYQTWKAAVMRSDRDGQERAAALHNTMISRRFGHPSTRVQRGAET